MTVFVSSAVPAQDVVVRQDETDVTFQMGFVAWTNDPVLLFDHG
jgi:hypothetical protein